MQTTVAATAERAPRTGLGWMSLAALGVVFEDIGTSPLYAMLALAILCAVERSHFVRAVA